MTTTLITDWSAYEQAFAEIVGQATQRIDVFDQDLARLPFERAAHADHLRRFLSQEASTCLRMVLRNTDLFRRNSPRLMQLLSQHAHRMSVVQCPEQLASMSDSMVLVDNRHGLIRFHQDNVRSKRIDDDPEACQIYALRFSEILKEGGELVTATTLGL